MQPQAQLFCMVVLYISLADALMSILISLSIGMKRNIAVGTARGEIIVHWDDDDWYAADRVTIQVAPIIAGRADLTMLPHHTVYMLMEDQYYQLVSKGYWGAHFGTLVGDHLSGCSAVLSTYTRIYRLNSARSMLDPDC